MPQSKNNDFENDPFKKEEPDDDLFTSQENDPFADLLSKDEPEENENTMQRLSHLEASAQNAKQDDGETTEAKLAQLLDKTPVSSAEAKEATDQQLANILSDIDTADDSPAENTMARLGNFKNEFERQKAEKAKSLAEEPDSFDEDEEDLLDSISDDSIPEEESLVSEMIASDPSLQETPAESSPFDLPASGESSEWGDSANPFAPIEEPQANAAAQENVKSPKNKKEKKTKKKANKTPQIKVEKKKRKKKEKLPRTGYDVLLSFIFFLFLAIIGLGNFVGFKSTEFDKNFFFTAFNILSFVLILIPLLLKTVKKRRIGISFFDTLVAIALSFLIFGCMALVMVQAKYGTRIKVTESAISSEISGPSSLLS